MNEPRPISPNSPHLEGPDTNSCCSDTMSNMASSQTSVPRADRAGQIEIRDCTVHNLQHVDLDLPHRRLIAFCGVSGSGKSSLAIDTLYAEGQRRYIETFSAQVRLGLQRFEKPEVERIDGIPPTIAVTSLLESGCDDGGGSSAYFDRATVATETEIHDYLRLLFTRIGRRWCDCGSPVQRDTPQTILRNLTQTFAAGIRAMIAFPWSFTHENSISDDTLNSTDSTTLAIEQLLSIRRHGFLRILLGDKTFHLSDSDDSLIPTFVQSLHSDEIPQCIVDRITIPNSQDDTSRILESLETAFCFSDGSVTIYAETPQNWFSTTSNTIFQSSKPPKDFCYIDGRSYIIKRYSDRFDCPRCGRKYEPLRPEMFYFHSSLGVCPTCKGAGERMELDIDRIVPDPRRTLADGAIAPWTHPTYRGDARRMLQAAPAMGISTNIPFRSLSEDQVHKLMEGDLSQDFPGLKAFFENLERRQYQSSIRAFLNRWRSSRPCPACGGSRLRPESLMIYIGGGNTSKNSSEKSDRNSNNNMDQNSGEIRDSRSKNIAEIQRMKVDEALLWFSRDFFAEDCLPTVCHPLKEIRSRLAFLQSVGLGYLTLDRSLRTLSSGESRRIALSSALGSSLVNMLYIIDEPSIGLHCKDIDRLPGVLRQLCDRGNTVIVSDHQESILLAADELVEVGPGAGERGGQIVFQGTPSQLLQSTESFTGEYLTGRRGRMNSGRRRSVERGWLHLTGASGRNLQNISVDFPLGVLCVVTGPSGSGKSTLIADTLYPAFLAKNGTRDTSSPPLAYESLSSDINFDEVLFIDQTASNRSSRSNPATYLKIMDEIREVFAETSESKTRGLTPSHFSFNSGDGRCPTCHGDGRIVINMQFLPDVTMRCAACAGTRYRREVLEISYRNRNISEVLNLTAREAFTFFRGHPKVQNRLKRLMDVGLDYVRLGQPTDTLSGGELQRLRLASYISSAQRNRTLFLMDEPTSGLHFADVVQLLDCFDALLAVGHSIILIDHNLRLIHAADYVIDLGPGAAENGGKIVAFGTPETLMETSTSVTGPYLKKLNQTPIPQEDNI